MSSNSSTNYNNVNYNPVIFNSHPDSFKPAYYVMQDSELKTFYKTVRRIFKFNPDAGVICVKLPPSFEFKKLKSNVDSLKFKFYFEQTLKSLDKDKMNNTIFTVLTNVKTKCDGKKGQDIGSFLNDNKGCPFSDKEKILGYSSATTTKYPFDIDHSLADKESSGEFYLPDLPDVLKLTRIEDSVLPGITRPYVYIAIGGTYFGFHIEDHNLNSINIAYLVEDLEGVKVWYSIALSSSEVFRSLIQEKLKLCETTQNCQDLIVVKDIVLISELELKEAGIKFQTLEQSPGFMMITRGIHGGMNIGKGICTEAVNFCMPQIRGYGHTNPDDIYSLENTQSSNCPDHKGQNFGSGSPGSGTDEIGNPKISFPYFKTFKEMDQSIHIYCISEIIKARYLNPTIIQLFGSYDISSILYFFILNLKDKVIIKSKLQTLLNNLGSRNEKFFTKFSSRHIFLQSQDEKVQEAKRIYDYWFIENKNEIEFIIEKIKELSSEYDVKELVTELGNIHLSCEEHPSKRIRLDNFELVQNDFEVENENENGSELSSIEKIISNLNRMGMIDVDYIVNSLDKNVRKLFQKSLSQVRTVSLKPIQTTFVKILADSMKTGVSEEMPKLKANSSSYYLANLSLGRLQFKWDSLNEIKTIIESIIIFNKKNDLNEKQWMDLLDESLSSSKNHSPWNIVLNGKRGITKSKRQSLSMKIIRCLTNPENVWERRINFIIRELMYRLNNSNPWMIKSKLVTKGQREYDNWVKILSIQEKDFIISRSESFLYPPEQALFFNEGQVDLQWIDLCEYLSVNWNGILGIYVEKDVPFLQESEIKYFFQEINSANQL